MISNRVHTLVLRNIQTVLAVFATAIIIQTYVVKAQVETRGRSTDNVTEIFAEAFAFESDKFGMGRVDIYVQVPYKEISFVKDNEQYVGRFEVSVTVMTSENQQVWQKNQMVELRLKDVAQTTSARLSSLKQFSTDLPSGLYTLLLHIVDQESKKTAKLEYPLKVRDFSKDSLALSDLMLVHRMSMEGTRKNIVPNLTNSVEQGLGEFYMFFEIYNRVQLDSVQLICKFTNTQKEIVLQRSKYEVLSGNRTQVIWKIDTPALAADRYLISIEAMGSTKNLPGVQLTGSTLRTCLIKMKDLPVTITNIDKATDQLRYIALESDMDYIREAKTPEEKLKRFFDFWAKRDPDPKTPHNELMEEYYSRVDYANKNFIGYIEGWKTDMGMIYIHFGPPQNVERHPFDSDSKPYEIWYYYEQNREFIFVDETGFGDYRLRYPTTDLWGRIR